MIIILAVLIYFCALFLLSRVTARKGSNEAFFRANRRSPWYMVAYGMVGASISGITFVSVPGMVLTSAMSYLQVCLGFVVGYLLIAFVLLPVYYRMNVTSIYAYLDRRLGRAAHLTGSWFFLLSKLIGAAVKFYVVCLILQQLVLDARGVPFGVTTAVMVLLIWLYTRRGGIRTLVVTDVLQTTCLFAALLLIIGCVCQAMGFSPTEAVSSIAADARSQVFFTDDVLSRHYFWKEFISGAFIVVVMTGLDQDMMQKNLTCRTLREAQKDMCSYGLAFVPANLLFLALGVLLAQWAEHQGLALPAQGDALLSMFVAQQGQWVAVLFTLGILAASFSSADSALTSLTTCFCVDICRRDDDEQLRKRTHLFVCLVFVVVIMLFRAANSSSLIDAIYTIVGYTYGPLLGLFAFALFTHKQPRSAWVPVICVLSPLLCYAISQWTAHQWGYHFGYELLMMNGLLTIIGLYGVSNGK